jgi:Type II CAAX prenyl endopeptidase Rce1-like
MFCFAAIILFTVAMMVLSFPVGLYTVFGTTLSTTYSSSTPVHALVYDFLFATVQIPFDGTLGDVIVVFLAIYLGFFLVAAKQGTGVLGALRGSVSHGYSELFSNPLTATLILLGGTSLVTVAIDSIQTSSGIATGSLSGDPLSLLVSITIAPLFEETTFRVMLLGVPITVLSLILFRDLSPARVARVLWRPSSAWDVDETDGVGTRRSFADGDPALFPGYASDSLKARAMKPVVYVFLALSSFMFGYAHYASGAGWGPGKISEAALAGLALGYLYVKYGFLADVLLHWSINYVGTIYSFLAQGLWGIPWTSGAGSPLDVIPTVDFILLLGLPSTLILADALVKVMGRSRQSKKPTIFRSVN